MENKEVWDRLKNVDNWAKKTIKGGRLNGMTDIKPQWRYLRLTDEFGPIGFGWRFTVDKQWVEEGADGTKAAFVNVSLYIKKDGEWSEAIHGNGGSMFVAKEKSGLYTSDEAYKMATTDAIGTAAKLLGLAADVYMGGDHDSKYAKTSAADTAQEPTKEPQKTSSNEPPAAAPTNERDFFWIVNSSFGTSVEDAEQFAAFIKKKTGDHPDRMSPMKIEKWLKPNLMDLYDEWKKAA